MSLGQIICEAPNNRLDRFEGRLVYKDKQHPLSNEKMLLRGCRLRNTRWCYGVVVFAGKLDSSYLNDECSRQGNKIDDELRKDEVQANEFG